MKELTNRTDLYFPAEWHKREFVQLTWPHIDTDWGYMLDEVESCFIDIAIAISERQKLIIVTPEKQDVENTLRSYKANMNNISVISAETDDTWARDHGFITLLTQDDKEAHYLDYCFNGWGKKYCSYLDNAINAKLHKLGVVKGEYYDLMRWVLEGGSIESDGKGTVLTTSQCLMAPNRNDMDRCDLESVLCAQLHCKRMLWLDHGNLVGDDTDGHIDTIARFAPNDTIIYMQADENDNEQYSDLKMMEEQLKTFRTADDKPYRLLAVPSPEPIYDECGMRLPATYANFLIINGAVLYPTYAQPENDSKAGEVLQEAFPGYEIIGIDCRALIKQHGSLHCVTMQYPETIKE